MIQNWIKTFTLLIFLSALFLFVGYAIAGTIGIYISLIFSAIMNIMLFFYADKFVLRAYKAQPLNQTIYPDIHSMTQKLADKINIAVPSLWYIQTNIANAFAIGRSPQKSSIALTDGIIQLLNTNELRGVIAHELSHIQNRDTLINTIAATMSGALGYLAQSLRYAFLFTTRKKENNNKQHTQLLVAIIAPLIAVLVQLAISRTREYLADESAAYTTKDPLALASALEKMDKFKQHVYPPKGHTIYVTTSSLFFLFPFPKNGLTLLKTHPPISKRIERLKKIYEQMISFKK